MSPPATPPPSPAPNSGQPAPHETQAAVPARRIIVLIFNIAALVVLVSLIATRPTGAEATDAQPSSTWTAQPVYTTAPAPMFTPDVTATVKPTRTPHTSGPPRVYPTPTAAAPTATPVRIPTLQPTAPPNSG